LARAIVVQAVVQADEDVGVSFHGRHGPEAQGRFGHS